MANDEAKIELNVVLETLVDGAIIIDAYGTIVLFNKACTRIFGYETDEVIGKNVKMLMPQPYQTEHDGYLKSYADTRVKKIIGIGREVQGLKKNGTHFPLDLSIGETLANDEVLFIGIIRDLTQHHAQQRKYDELQEEHFHLSRVSALNEMGSAIAHELNQPLAASINYLETIELLLKKDAEIDIDGLSDITSLAMEQTQRASEIISRIREFIKHGDVTKEPTDLPDVIETAARLAFLGFEKHDIALKITVPDTLPTVLINELQIQQVLVNLMKNACEAMFDSQIKELEISAMLASCGQKVEVQVKDTGHGLSTASMINLFVPFSSEKPGGMGVGLSISKSIINHHGGQIWAHENKPQGSIFHFSLPLAGSVK